MITCTKRYEDIPFAHRQHRHDGHCKFVHGHNWAIVLTFACEELDENGFVVDFGKLKYIKKWIAEHIDHACLFNADDPEKDNILGSCPEAYKVYVVENCGCEGLAKHFYDVFNPMVQDNTAKRVWIQQVVVEEDSKNSASYRSS